MMKKHRISEQTFEFLTLFTMVVGTVIGAGIYIKNTEIVKATQNPIISIMLWAIVGVVCFLSVLVFMEISSSTKHFGNGTMGNWTKLFINRKTASFFALLYLVIYTPAFYALFTGTFIYFLFELIGVQLSAGVQLILYLTLGIFMMIFFALFNAFKPKWSKWLQVGGNIFKFIPLFIALVAGFVLSGKSGAMLNQGSYPGDHYLGDWSQHNWKATSFFRGFGGILLSFDGFYFIANSQKTATHKQVVPKALMVGMIFAASFYVLMAISLFLGSPDGSIAFLFKRMLGDSSVAARIIPNLMMMLICFLNLNIFSMIGMLNLESDVEAKLLFVGERRGKISKFKCAVIGMTTGIFFYTLCLMMGIFISRGEWNGWTTMNNSLSDRPVEFIGIMGSVGSILSFFIVDVLIFAALINRKTNKVKVEKYPGVPILSIISGIFVAIFILAGLYTFIDSDPTHQTRFVDTSGLYFLILFVSLIVLTIIAWLIQEQLFKIHPFLGGFDGYLDNEDFSPFMFKFKPWKNYYRHNPKAKLSPKKTKNDKIK